MTVTFSVSNLLVARGLYRALVNGSVFVSLLPETLKVFEGGVVSLFQDDLAHRQFTAAPMSRTTAGIASTRPITQPVRCVPPMSKPWRTSIYAILATLERCLPLELELHRFGGDLILIETDALPL